MLKEMIVYALCLFEAGGCALHNSIRVYNTSIELFDIPTSTWFNFKLDIIFGVTIILIKLKMFFLQH